VVKNYVSNKDETARMFKSDFMEALSKVHWTVPLYIYVPVVLACLYYAKFQFSLGWGEIVLYLIAGILVWSFSEYTLHRFVFHFHATSDFGKRMTFIFHGVHHDYPNDSKRLVMPPSASIPLALLFFFLFLWLLGEVYVTPFFAGFIIGYLFYDITHYAIHHFNMKNKFWLAIKNHHMIHHYKYPNLGYGVSQPAWDYVFRTTYPKKESVQD
jgi:sterol desaturase/sphingolipid hydroxylase (fatty acid hydroxylase superfamily)